MAVGGPFTPGHVSALATRASELERIGEETQNPHALMRAARLYKLAVSITDDINGESAPFTYADLARVRDELRTLATDTAVAGMLGDHGIPSRAETDASGDHYAPVPRDRGAHRAVVLPARTSARVRRRDPEPRA